MLGALLPPSGCSQQPDSRSRPLTPDYPLPNAGHSSGAAMPDRGSSWSQRAAAAGGGGRACSEGIERRTHLGLSLQVAGIMLRAQRLPRSLVRAGLRTLSCCAAAEGLTTSAPQPGTVSEYVQHLLVGLPGSAASAAADVGAAWPQLVEK